MCQEFDYTMWAYLIRERQRQPAYTVREAAPQALEPVEVLAHRERPGLIHASLKRLGRAMRRIGIRRPLAPRSA